MSILIFLFLYPSYIFQKIFPKTRFKNGLLLFYVFAIKEVSILMRIKTNRYFMRRVQWRQTRKSLSKAFNAPSPKISPPLSPSLKRGTLRSVSMAITQSLLGYYSLAPASGCLNSSQDPPALSLSITSILEELYEIETVTNFLADKCVCVSE